MTAGQHSTLNAEVLFPFPGGGPWIYHGPESLLPGMRVVAPLGGRTLTGVVLETGVEAPPGVRLRSIRAVVDERPLLSPGLVELIPWLAEHYFCEPGEALRAVVPAVFLRVGDRLVSPVSSLADGLPARLPACSAQQQILLARLKASGPRLLSELRREFPAALGTNLARLEEQGLVTVDDHLPRLPSPRLRTLVELADAAPAEALERLLSRPGRQRELYEALRELAHPVESTHVTGLMGFSGSVVKALLDKGLLRKRQVEQARDPFREIVFAPYESPSPYAAQRAAIEAVQATRGEHRVFLLHGVTGSGKTLVYLELIAPLVARGGQAIVLVPEIALTPQTTGRFRAVFGDRVAVLHSGLSDGERYDIWRGIRAGRYAVAVGARSAVFAPFERLEIVIIDEEHEHTYKQSDLSPRYHAREVAIQRMRRAQGPVVLGSATPCLESFHRAALGEYTRLALPERVLGRKLPKVEIHDLRRGWVRQGKQLLTPLLLERIGRALEQGGQVLLLLNRRGFHNFVLCGDCGEVVSCRHCQISLTVHRRPERLLCHYCGFQQPPPAACPACGARALSSLGMGTEQVEKLLREAFPERTIDRMDVDTTGGKWSHHEILERLRTGATDILVGTQMIAKGLDFPDVLLVGVVNADTALNLPDFRAAERTFGLLAQVAGRTGRGDRGGEVFIQTFNPSHPAVRAAVEHDYLRFAAAELQLRREAGYPPYVSLLNVILSGTEERAVEAFAVRAGAFLGKVIEEARLEERLILLGPAPCPVIRIRDRWRHHLILKAHDQEALELAGRRLARELAVPSRGQCRLLLDRDPITLM